MPVVHHRNHSEAATGCGRTDATSETADAQLVTCKLCLKHIERLNRPPETTRKRWFHSKVAGVSHLNDDGSSRQRIISSCQPGERLVPVRERKNRYDRNAVRLDRRNGQTIGYLSRETAEEVAFEMDNSETVWCEIADVTGGSDGKSFGVNIVIHIGYGDEAVPTTPPPSSMTGTHAEYEPQISMPPRVPSWAMWLFIAALVIAAVYYASK